MSVTYLVHEPLIKASIFTKWLVAVAILSKYQTYTFEMPPTLG